ncbi:MAG TPA: hypothetical protein VNZ84_05920, partial [Methylophilus sp.]|nr:hypothetical protein [Methylophilus sp.]
MYEQISHAILNDTLRKLTTGSRDKEWQYFYTRLGANFYAIYSLFHHLYGHLPDFKPQLAHL